MSRTYGIPEASYFADIQGAGEQRDIRKGLEAALKIEEVMLANGAYYRGSNKKMSKKLSMI